MEVILLERIEKLGQMGDVVRVKDGYARNYLLPQKKALRASDANKGHYENRKAELEAINLKLKDEAVSVAKKIEGMQIIVIRQAGENGQLYGSVTPRDITNALREEGVKMEKNQVDLDTTIKQLGKFSVPLKLHSEVKVNIDVTVSRSKDQMDIEELDENSENKEENNENDTETQDQNSEKSKESE